MIRLANAATEPGKSPRRSARAYSDPIEWDRGSSFFVLRVFLTRTGVHFAGKRSDARSLKDGACQAQTLAGFYPLSARGFVSAGGLGVSGRAGPRC
jgi:hypothetical protein